MNHDFFTPDPEAVRAWMDKAFPYHPASVPWQGGNPNVFQDAKGRFFTMIPGNEEAKDDLRTSAPEANPPKPAAPSPFAVGDVVRTIEGAFMDQIGVVVELLSPTFVSVKFDKKTVRKKVGWLEKYQAPRLPKPGDFIGCPKHWGTTSYEVFRVENRTIYVRIASTGAIVGSEEYTPEGLKLGDNLHPWTFRDPA